ncbi:MAG TPA: ATP-binding protein [Candidatus Acidoferrum sp.]|nr:ATP-binding protein [Candidatus Acidoferrum sp.]
MISAPIPENEAERLEALRRYQILDTGSESAFDDLAALASYICGTPIALVSLVDSDRQWFKAKVGVDASETPRDVSFCAHTILAEDTLVVEDALADNRFADNPLVTTDPKIRFYAGAKLATSDGYALGSLCVVDRVPRQLTPAQKEALQALSRQVVVQMEYKRNVLEMAEIIAERKQTEELKAANQAAQAASRAKSEFLANISHELRTPLNGIIGMTELVLESELTSEQRENLEVVKTSADSLLSLVDNILDFSEIESGKAVPEAVEYGLRDIVNEVVAVTAPRARAKGLSIVYHTRPDVPDVVIGDPERVRQIIGHLVSNAIKFTERGEIVIEMGAEMALKDGILLHCSVADTGTGIAPEKQQSIFDVFTQGDGSVTRIHGGMGLGLTISSRLVEKLGGRLWVDSEPGSGSKFHFTFRQGVRRKGSRRR